MADLPSPLRLTHMTWPEVERARDGVELVLLPIGSIEQHGPNTSLDTDLVICEDLSLRLAERFHPRLLVAPTMPYGMSTYHMGFPGSITLRPQTFLHVLEDQLASLLHHGFTRFLLTNWHSGNTSIMNLSMQTLPTRLPLDFLAAISLYDLEDDDLEDEIVKSPTSGHACELETAELMALRPDRVKYDDLAPGDLSPRGSRLRQRFWRRSIRRNHDFSDFSANGAVGDATLATAEDGWRMIKVIEERADKLITTLLDSPDDLLARGRIPGWRHALHTR